MRILFAAFITLALVTTALCQYEDIGEQKAFINNCVGAVFYREKPSEKEILLPKKKAVAKKLFPGQEVRCEGKDCSLELQMCTRGKKTLRETDGWYRIPALACDETYIPGFSNEFRRGGRTSVLKSLPQSLFAYAGSSWSSGKIVTANYSAGASNRFRNFDAQRFFAFPYEGVVVIPKYFEFDIKQRKVHFFIILSAFGDSNPLQIQREWKKELFFENDVLKTSKDDPFDIQEISSFLAEVKKYSKETKPRIFCTISAEQISKLNEVSLHTFGFEFFIMESRDEQIVLDQLEISDKETGVARYLGRADIFEYLGLPKAATGEYEKALKEFPENEVIESKLSEIKDLRFE